MSNFSNFNDIFINAINEHGTLNAMNGGIFCKRSDFSKRKCAFKHFDDPGFYANPFQPHSRSFRICPFSSFTLRIEKLSHPVLR